MSSKTLSMLEQLDGARFVRVEGTVVFVWYGGPIVNIMRPTATGETLTTLDCWSMQPTDERGSIRHPTYLEVHDAVLERIGVAPVCPDCDKAMSARDRKVFEREGGKGWPRICEDCAEKPHDPLCGLEGQYCDDCL